MRIERINRDHTSDIEDILLQHLSGDSINDTHIPMDNILSKKSKPKGYSMVSDMGQVLGMMASYHYKDKQKMIHERVSGRVKPSASSIKSEELTFLAYAYVDIDHMNQGIGTKLLEQIINLEKSERNSQVAFCESWIYNQDLDSRHFLKSRGFEVFFWPKNYWGGSGECSYHNKLKTTCDCEGAIFRRELKPF